VTYAPVWLRGEEIYRLLGGREKARPWIERAIIDRGIVANCDNANPARDLFRLPHRGWRWDPNIETINWDTLEILARCPSSRDRDFYQMTPIEASAQLLLSLAPPMQQNRRYANDDTLVDEAIEGIANGKWASPHAAAQALAPRAQGNSTEEAKVTRLGKKIRRRLPA